MNPPILLLLQLMMVLFLTTTLVEPVIFRLAVVARIRLPV
jgi:hypothetical protein